MKREKSYHTSKSFQNAVFTWTVTVCRYLVESEESDHTAMNIEYAITYPSPTN